MSLTFPGTLNEAIQIPPDVLEALAAPTKRAPILVVINDVELRTTIMVYGGIAYIGLRAEVRKAMGVAPGETFDVQIALDTEPRVVDVPEELGALLEADPQAKQAFERLSFTNRKEYVEWVSGAKGAATRQKRLGQVTEMLKSGRRTPL